MKLTYPELVAKVRSQWERGLLTQKEYESEIMYLAQAEVNRLAPYRVTLMWSEVGHMRGIAHCDSETALATLIDDYIESYELNVLYRMEVTGGSSVLVCIAGDKQLPCTIVVDKRQKF